MVIIAHNLLSSIMLLLSISNLVLAEQSPIRNSIAQQHSAFQKAEHIWAGNGHEDVDLDEIQVQKKMKEVHGVLNVQPHSPINQANTVQENTNKKGGKRFRDQKGKHSKAIENNTLKVMATHGFDKETSRKVVLHEQNRRRNSRYGLPTKPFLLNGKVFDTSQESIIPFRGKAY